MLQGIRFLFSVAAAAAVARLAHARVMSLCSPTSPAAAAGIWLAPARAARKAQHPAALAVEDNRPAGGAKELLVVSPQPATAPARLVKGSSPEDTPAGERKRAARSRPPRLVIPSPPMPRSAGPGDDPFGEAAGRETDMATELEVQGEGFCLASRRGVRHAMEDGYGVVTDNIDGDAQLAFYGVYDGHGGRAAVDFVADKLGKNVVAALAAGHRQRRPGPASSPSSWSPAQGDADAVTVAIRSAYLTTDSEFLSQGVRGGACAATALVKDGELYVANVGDCRAVLGSRGGVATALTNDHTACREDERRRIESSGGYVSCGSGGVWRVQDCLAVSRAFGDASMKPWVTCEPEVSRRRLTPDCHFLVVASDGLWSKVSCQEAVHVVAGATAAVSTSSSVASCQELVAMARSRGSRDDITVMVVDLQRFVR